MKKMPEYNNPPIEIEHHNIPVVVVHCWTIFKKKV